MRPRPSHLRRRSNGATRAARRRARPRRRGATSSAAAPPAYARRATEPTPGTSRSARSSAQRPARSARASSATLAAEDVASASPPRSSAAVCVPQRDEPAQLRAEAVERRRAGARAGRPGRERAARRGSGARRRAAPAAARRGLRRLGVELGLQRAQPLLQARERLFDVVGHARTAFGARRRTLRAAGALWRRKHDRRPEGRRSLPLAIGARPGDAGRRSPQSGATLTREDAERSPRCEKWTNVVAATTSR